MKSKKWNISIIKLNNLFQYYKISAIIIFESASEFCNKNNDVFITPDGNAKVCRMKQDEIQLLDDIKNKNERELSNKLSLSFKKLGESCPFEKKCNIIHL